MTKVTKYMATTNTLPTNYATNYYEGMTLGELWGYTCNGLFQSNEEAQTYADYSKFAQNKIVWQKGDPKYEDLNGDGRIDISDMVQMTAALLGRSSVKPN